MTRRRPPYIEPKHPVYIGCEGKSEAGYANILQDLLKEKELAVYLVVEILGPGAGDPLVRIEMAVRHLNKLKRTRLEPKERFVMLDFDQAERDQARAKEARVRAGKHNITILWQRPCFEAVLLRHPG